MANFAFENFHNKRDILVRFKKPLIISIQFHGILKNLISENLIFFTNFILGPVLLQSMSSLVNDYIKIILKHIENIKHVKI